MAQFNANRMTTEQAASYLGLREGTLNNWRSSGSVSLPYHKIGGRVYYTLADLDDWLESTKRTHTAAK